MPFSKLAHKTGLQQADLIKGLHVGLEVVVWHVQMHMTNQVCRTEILGGTVKCGGGYVFIRIFHVLGVVKKELKSLNRVSSMGFRESFARLARRGCYREQ